MSKKQQVPNRQYVDEFKVEAVRLAESIGANQAAKRLGFPIQVCGTGCVYTGQASSRRREQRTVKPSQGSAI